ncbi:RNA polymerase sigma factor [Aeoliella mucimassa]|uniref:ECF RNA polymerase sigma factor SigW n=1 Tax=Aeoliella mucimassa TaxID=2527972 RepID=A0A518ATS1_9BACT|nr:sigma-70 family RNA polymerase sigma factor [Aeoliella mucimassa]QDU58096.1 ECF RNA polymerase sigma factor SigW [Aeoliella mucimassa]
MTAIELLNLSEATLEQLIAAALDGDRAAQGELVERYQGMVMSIGMKRLGDYAEAQELCQEVFVKALDRLHQLQEPAAFGGWLRSITVRMAINRQVRRPPVVSAEPQTLAATYSENSTPLDAAVRVEQAEQVHVGLRRLGTMDRDTLTAFYLRGESLLEMSEATGAPVGTIKRRLHVARKRLAAELETLQAI